MDNQTIFSKSLWEIDCLDNELSMLVYCCLIISIGCWNNNTRSPWESGQLPIFPICFVDVITNILMRLPTWSHHFVFVSYTKVKVRDEVIGKVIANMLLKSCYKRGKVGVKYCVQLCLSTGLSSFVVHLRWLYSGFGQSMVWFLRNQVLWAIRQGLRLWELIICSKHNQLRLSTT